MCINWGSEWIFSRIPTAPDLDSGIWQSFRRTDEIISWKKCDDIRFQIEKSKRRINKLIVGLLYGKGLFLASSVFWPFPSTAIVLRGTGQKPETPFIQKIIIKALNSIIRLQSWHVQMSPSTKLPSRNSCNDIGLSRIMFSCIYCCNKASSQLILDSIFSLLQQCNYIAWKKKSLKTYSLHILGRPNLWKSYLLDSNHLVI